MTPDHPTPDNDLLDDLARLTGLFNPETIWHEEERLDDLTEAEEAAAPPTSTAPTRPDER